MCNNLLKQPSLIKRVWLVIISWSPTDTISRQVDPPPSDLVLVILLLVLLDAYQVLPPQVLGHMTRSVGVMGQCFCHLKMRKHWESEDRDVQD